MKKSLSFTALISAALVLIIVLTGCTAGNKGGTVMNNTLTGEIADDILSAVEIPSPVLKSKDDVQILITGIDVSVIQDVSYYICGSGAYPDELLIIKFSNAEEAAKAMSAVQKRLDSRKDDFRDYRPEEMYKLDDAVIQTDANWLFFFATSDNVRVKEIVSSYVKG